MQPHRRNNVNQSVPPELPGTKLQTRVHMEGLMAPAAYVSEDGIDGHEREEWSLILRWLDAPI